MRSRTSLISRCIVAIVAVVIMTSAASAKMPTLSGKWRIRSLGDFRNVTLTHKGRKLEAHRVLWPEFQGERYQLEHLYRGRIQGNSICGELHVREDGKGKFESLRPFTGSIETDGTVILDGMPLRRAQ